MGENEVVLTSILPSGGTGLSGPGRWDGVVKSIEFYIYHAISPDTIIPDAPIPKASTGTPMFSETR